MEETPEKSKKATNLEVLRRIDRVVDLLVNGAMVSDIRQNASAEGWPLSERRIRDYVRRAGDVISAQMERDRQKVLDLAVCMRSKLFAEAKANGELKICLEILRDLGTLQNLYPTTKTAVTLETSTKPGAMTDAELDALIAKRKGEPT